MTQEFNFEVQNCLPVYRYPAHPCLKYVSVRETAPTIDYLPQSQNCLPKVHETSFGLYLAKFYTEFEGIIECQNRNHKFGRTLDHNAEGCSRLWPLER